MSDRDNITLPREVVELALDALEFAEKNHGGDDCYADSITALRAALAAEPTKPSEVGELIENLMHHAYNDGVKQLKYRSSQTVEAEEALRTALAAEQPKTPAWWRDGLAATLMREGVNKHRAREIAVGYWEAYCQIPGNKEDET